MNPRPLLFLLLLCTCAPSPQSSDSANSENTPDMHSSASIDWQGHRGCRGLLPENTIPAFLRALSYPEVITLELDVVISADERVIVSHEPWMSAEICLDPAGNKLSAEEDQRVKIMDLTVEEIARYDCGQLPHLRFPEQVSRPASKPTLAAVFAAVDRYCVQNERPSPRYNIELKYEAEHEGSLVPDRSTFVDLVLADVDAWGKPELVTLQCFDPPTLKVIHEKRPEIQLAYLDEFPGDVQEKMNAIGFVPAIYSPYEIHVDKSLLQEARGLGMRVIPWTVNDVTRMQELLAIGVDGIITDYPNRIAEALN